MNRTSSRPRMNEEIVSFQRDGAVLLSGLFQQSWIELHNEGLDANCNNPTDRSRVWDRDEKGHTMFWDSQAWQRVNRVPTIYF